VRERGLWEDGARVTTYHTAASQDYAESANGASRSNDPSETNEQYHTENVLDTWQKAADERACGANGNFINKLLRFSQRFSSSVYITALRKQSKRKMSTVRLCLTSNDEEFRDRESIEVGRLIKIHILERSAVLTHTSGWCGCFRFSISWSRRYCIRIIG
jgi:hypothetical protein